MGLGEMLITERLDLVGLEVYNPPTSGATLRHVILMAIRMPDLVLGVLLTPRTNIVALLPFGHCLTLSVCPYLTGWGAALMTALARSLTAGRPDMAGFYSAAPSL